MSQILSEQPDGTPTPRLYPTAVIGRIVQFTFGKGFEQWSNWKSDSGQSKTVPAIITQVWGEECVNLTVFIDGEKCTLAKTSVGRIDNPDDDTVQDSWCWPVLS